MKETRPRAELLGEQKTSLVINPQVFSIWFRSGEHAGWSKRVKLLLWKKLFFRIVNCEIIVNCSIVQKTQSWKMTTTSPYSQLWFDCLRTDSHFNSCFQSVAYSNFLSHYHIFLSHFKSLLRTFLRSSNTKCKSV